MSGQTPVALPTGEDVERHIVRAFYLTARVEAPTWGSVRSYDNAGMSGGPMHWIAHFARTGGQGPLFPLLRTIEIGLGGAPNAYFGALKAALAKVGWVVAASDGQLRSISDGTVVSGRAIRDELAAPGGLVPATGPGRRKAENWAMLFHELLAGEVTFHAQREHAISCLLRGQRQAETEVYRLLLERVWPPRPVRSRAVATERALHASAPRCGARAQARRTPVHGPVRLRCVPMEEPRAVPQPAVAAMTVGDH